jgi:hypothetical protein
VPSIPGDRHWDSSGANTLVLVDTLMLLVAGIHGKEPITTLS